MLCIFLIFGNVLINMYYTSVYDLRIGMITVHNYFLLSSILAKPWTKLANVALGMLLAGFYMQVLEYRKIKCNSLKAIKFPKIHMLHKKPFLGQASVSLGFLIISINLFGPTFF
jgi:hypothetical protein